MKLQVQKLAKVYAGHEKPIEALSPASFDVAGGEFVSLLGPSGCGKSTLLHLIAGLETASRGEVLLDGAKVIGPGQDRGVVFQNYTLFPWLTVSENVCFGSLLRCNAAERRRAPEASAARAESLLSLMGLAGFRGAYPRELSGGMKQRVAIARALANRPKVLLMDEPFGALDAQTREEMQELMMVLHAAERPTVLFVTHDVEEAVFLSTRVLVFSPRPGRIVRDVAVPFGPMSERSPELKLLPEFMQIKRELIRLLHPGAKSAVERAALLNQITHPN
jgi:NitT/TauT family transport system ATP-binding protein